MDGILVIDKPVGFTSHDVVAKLRRKLRTKKIGHTGTLDPFATGVLVMMIGKATRLAQFLDKDEKEYIATARFGFATDTGDLTGEKIAETGVSDDEVATILATTDWDTVLANFRGSIEQTPPMYSAKKIDGRKLYELARKGETVDRNAVSVNISHLECTATDDPLTRELRVACSAGTYIRTLAEDIGKSIGIGAHLTELRRTRAGRYNLDDAIGLEELEEMPDPVPALTVVETALKQFAELRLTAERAAATLNGLSTSLKNSSFDDGETIRMTDDESGRLVAIGIYDSETKVVRPKIVLG